MTMHFRYKRTNRPDGTIVKTPSLPVTIIGEKNSVDTIAIIDSGADISVIPEGMAEILDLDLSGKTQTAFGIGGEVETVERRINIMIEKGHECYRLNIPVKIVLGKYDFPPLLGRAGFFDEFIINFSEGKERFSLKKFFRNERL
jgi:hypothetical protein